FSRDWSSDVCSSDLLSKIKYYEFKIDTFWNLARSWVYIFSPSTGKHPYWRVFSLWNRNREHRNWCQCRIPDYGKPYHFTLVYLLSPQKRIYGQGKLV